MFQSNEMELPELLAWRTWRESPGWTAIEHLLLALMGENGEMAELLKKERFKPGYQMPPFARVDELGDVWYYTRILGIHLNKAASRSVGYAYTEMGFLKCHIKINAIVAQMGTHVLERQQMTNVSIMDLTWPIGCALEALHWTFDELTLLNWWKLSGGKHGWPDKPGIEIPDPAEIQRQLRISQDGLMRVFRAHEAMNRKAPDEWEAHIFRTEESDE